MSNHQCAQQPDFVSIVQYDNDWYLEISRRVPKEELEQTPYDENIGDALWITQCMVMFCPFCSERLADSMPFEKRQQQPSHFDFRY